MTHLLWFHGIDWENTPMGDIGWVWLFMVMAVLFLLYQLWNLWRHW